MLIIFGFYSHAIVTERKDVVMIFFFIMDPQFTHAISAVFQGVIHQVSENPCDGDPIRYNFRKVFRHNPVNVFFIKYQGEFLLKLADYFFDKTLWLTARYGQVNYRDVNSQRISFGVNTNYGSINFRKTLGYEGELFSVSGYSAKTFFEGQLTPSVGISYTQYRLSTDDPTNHLITVLAGFNYRPIRMLSFDLQGQYMDNKIYSNDYRVFLKANYWFNTNF